MKLEIPAGSDSFRETLRAIALNVESCVNESGFDQPAMYFTVQFEDADETLELAATAGEPIPNMTGQDLAVAYSCNLNWTTNNHPYQALIGEKAPPDVIAVLLLSEAWMSSLNDDAPNAERTEVRLINVIGRDNTTISMLRARGEEPTAIDDSGAISGRLINALRRTLDLNSEPTLGPAPSYPDVAQRFKAATLISLLAGLSAVDISLLCSSGELDMFNRSWGQSSVFGVSSNWDELCAALRAHIANGEEVSLFGVENEFINWADNPMIAEQLDSGIPTHTELHEGLNDAATSNKWEADFVAQVRDAIAPSNP